VRSGRIAHQGFRGISLLRTETEFDWGKEEEKPLRKEVLGKGTIPL
jgi:hypothetical protein